MKKLLLSVLLLTLVAGYSFAQINVTFRVDMRGYQMPFITANVNGTFNGWCGPCNPLTDANNDSIWEATISLPPGVIEYKFTVDGWTSQENLTPGTPCTITTSGFTNRIFTISSNVVLPVDCWGKCGACGVLPPAKQQISLPITWQDTASVNYFTSDFGGTFSSLAANPVDASKRAFSILKTNTAETWAGTVLGTNAGFATNIPFNANSNQMQAMVYSPDAGATFRLKVEDKTDNTIAVETDAIVTAANTWQVITFNFTNHAQGTPAINYANNYNKLIIFPNFGIAGAAAGNKTYFIGEVAFGSVSSTRLSVKSDAFGLYPNPNNGAFTMSSSVFAGKTVDLSISDITGKVVYTEQMLFNGTERSFALNSIVKPGLYLVAAKCATGESAIKRVIVQ